MKFSCNFIDHKLLRTSPSQQSKPVKLLISWFFIKVDQVTSNNILIQSLKTDEFLEAELIRIACSSPLGKNRFNQGNDSNWAKEWFSRWAPTWQNQQSDCAPSEDSDQPGQPPSLIRVFAVRMKKACILSYPLSAQRKLWSVRTGWSESSLGTHSFCWFCHVVAQMPF